MTSTPTRNVGSALASWESERGNPGARGPPEQARLLDEQGDTACLTQIVAIDIPRIERA